MPAELTLSDLKYYPHFDGLISVEKANKLVSNPDRVASHKFFPFIRYDVVWQPFRQKTNENRKPKKKLRPIRYAARRDAYIFTHYRRILSDLYENELRKLGIEQCPIAYRKLTDDRSRGKCNIHFAKDAIDELLRLGDCHAVALDIEGYFENLDHAQIKDIWLRLLNRDRLPKDHFAVFKNITDYHFVDETDVYIRLGFAERITHRGRTHLKYCLPRKKMPKQLCSPQEFREKICGQNPAYNSLIRGNTDNHGNKLSYGIPQGAPISDVIANMYLLDFDCEMNRFAQAHHGKYMRYSDDILLIASSKTTSADAIIDFTKTVIASHGRNLSIKDSKTCVVACEKEEDRLAIRHVLGPQGKNGFEYLGFRFDGQRVYLRDSTISRFYRKAASKTRANVNRFLSKHPEYDASDIHALARRSFFVSHTLKARRKKFDPRKSKTWTFHTYNLRAANIFGPIGQPITRQLRNCNRFIDSRAEKYISSIV